MNLRDYPTDKLALKQGCYRDDSELNSYLSFINDNCLLDANFDNEPLELHEFQIRDIIGPLLGWKKGNGNLRWSLSAWLGPKKFGKSELASSLICWWCSTKRDQNIKVLASTEKQAREVCFGNLLRYRELNPTLQRRWKVKDTKGIIEDKVTGSRITVEACNATGASGPSIDLLHLDEWAEAPSHIATKLWDRLKYAAATRKKSALSLVTTTPSHEAFVGIHPSQTIWQQANEVLDGKNKDTGFHAVVYGAAMEADPSKPSTWKQAGPHVGTMVSLDFYKEQYARVKSSPIDLIGFQIYMLGQWQQSKSNWISLADYKRCKRGYSEEDLLGLPCSIGIDFAGVNDICSFTLLIRKDDELYTLSRNHLTEEALQRKVATGQTHFLAWKEQGLLKTSDEPTLSIDTVEQWLSEDFEKFDVKSISFDPYGLGELEQRLTKQKKLIIAVPPFPKYIGPLLINLKRMVQEERIYFDDNPIMLWCIQNLQVKESTNGQLNSKKLDLKGKIDAAQALLFSLNGLPELEKKKYQGPSVIAL